MFSKKRIATLSLLFCVLFSVAGQSVLTPQILSQNRWYNDEFSFDFKDDETLISYYTLGATTGTLRGKPVILSMGGFTGGSGIDQGIILGLFFEGESLQIRIFPILVKEGYPELSE